MACSAHCARETSSDSGESEGKLAGGLLSFVDEGDVKGKERVDVVVGCCFGDSAGVLCAVSAVGSSLFNRNDQVGEESCFGSGGRSCGSFGS